MKPDDSSKAKPDIPTVISASSHRMLIKFHSDEYRSGRGYRFRVDIGKSGVLNHFIFKMISPNSMF